MPDSPKIDGTATIKLAVKINGRAMNDTYQIVSLQVEKSVNKVPWAQIELSDGDMADMQDRLRLMQRENFRMQTRIDALEQRLDQLARSRPARSPGRKRAKQKSTSIGKSS